MAEQWILDGRRLAEELRYQTPFQASPLDEETVMNLYNYGYFKLIIKVIQEAWHWIPCAEDLHYLDIIESIQQEERVYLDIDTASYLISWIEQRVSFLCQIDIHRLAIHQVNYPLIWVKQMEYPPFR